MFKIHDSSLTDLIDRLNFTQGLYYTWTGKFPTEEQEAVLNACLVALMDHGQEALSAKAARVAASGGAQMHAAVAAGMLAAGKHHGTIPLQEAEKMLIKAVEEGQSAAEIVRMALEEGKRLPGFGHRQYEIDPRTQALLKKAESLGMKDAHVDLALEIEAELEKQKGKKLCLNVDGAIAALAPGLGLSPNIAPALFLVARTVGLAKHVQEEQTNPPASQRQRG